MKLIPIQPKGDLFNVAKVGRAITGTLIQAAADARGDLEKTVATWKHKVGFVITPIPDGFQVSTSDEIWKFVDEGTKAHLIPAIVPVNKKALTILGPGQPKTAVRVIGSTAGSRGGVVAIVKRTKPIEHPGTTAREFTETVQTKWDDELPRRIADALSQALGG